MCVLNYEALSGYLIQNGYVAEQPLLLAFDCDRTLVNRNISSHYIPKSLQQAFQRIKQNKYFITVINTGRDNTNFIPLAKQLCHADPSIFIAGRIVVIKNQIYVNENAVLPKQLIQFLAQLLIKEQIPFLDIKSSYGNVFLSLKDRQYENLFGHHRPLDWFYEVPLIKWYVSQEEVEHALEELFPIIRIEMPLLKADWPALYEICERHESVKTFFNNNGLSHHDLSMTIVATHPTRKNKTEQIFSIRFMQSAIHKGIGLRKIVNYYSIPEQNIIMFGDSSQEPADDICVKREFPRSVFIVPNDGDIEAKKHADFIIPALNDEGICQALRILEQFQSKYSKIKKN